MFDEYEFDRLRSRAEALLRERNRLRKALESIRDSEVRTNGETNLAVYINEILKLEQTI